MEDYQAIKNIIQNLSLKSIEKNQKSTKEILLNFYLGK